MTRMIYRRVIPAQDPRLKRQVNHDSESRRFAFDGGGVRITDVEHQRFKKTLNQLQVGSCTADTGFQVMSCAPFFTPDIEQRIISRFGSFDQQGAYRLYNEEETLDGDGPFPPQDNGSSGLTLAKCLRNDGIISGWTQTFSLEQMLQALMTRPVAIGVNWYNSMFEPRADGTIVVNQSSGLAGGHEFTLFRYDAARGLVGMWNSWGSEWGIDDGCAWLQGEDVDTLLHQEGDVTVFEPITQPAPTPTPVPDPSPTDADRAFASVLRPWVTHHHIGDNHKVQVAAQAWLATQPQ